MMAELAASLAHEIKQPIAAIAAGATAVLRWLHREPPEIEEACQSASRSSTARTVAAAAAHRRGLDGTLASYRQTVKVA